MKNKFENQISSFKEKTDKDILNYLFDYWAIKPKPNADASFKVVASYHYEGKDKNGNDYGNFVDVRSLNGDILYYPFELGKIKIYVPHNDTYKKEEFWQISVKLNEQKYREVNPFCLQLACEEIEKPRNVFVERLEKEKLIRKIFDETGSTKRDARNTAYALLSIMGDLYTESDERFIFELLQNADDQPKNDEQLVSVKLKCLNEHLLFMHSGKSFSKNDVESISSIGDSTKKNDLQKTGYKGIGFKSVFSDANTVFINSGNFSFAFDKDSPLYKNEENIDKIPWQLKPIWEEVYRLPKEVRNDNDYMQSCVGIALKLGGVKINNYKDRIAKLLKEPLFMLFLRHIGDLKYYAGNRVAEIRKTWNNNVVEIISDDIKTKWLVADCELEVPSEIREALQDDKLIPNKLKEAQRTKISFAVNVVNDKLVPVSNSRLFAYLPTRVSEFGFPFIVNADFLTTASREAIHYRNAWNVFLFEQMGTLIVKWAKKISHYDGYLRMLPNNDMQNGNHLLDKFNTSFRAALQSEAFILNHKGELAKQDEIVIDKTGLSEVIGADLFCQLLQTEKFLPSENIDSKIWEEDIFEDVELLKFDDVIEAITDNDAFNEWFTAITDEQKQALYKWVIDNNINEARENTLMTFAKSLPLFQFGMEYKSCREIESSNCIVTTEQVFPIKEALQKLGFVCSDNIFNENHSLYNFVKLKDDEKLFNTIQKCDFSKLGINERKNLFFTLKIFEGVGEAKLKGLSLFKNMNGNFKPLKEMIVYRENIPEWLWPYVISKGDYCNELADYLILQEEEFESVIQNNIKDIHAPLVALYNAYKDKWTGNFTHKIIDDYKIHNHKIDNDILAIIEESNNQTKKYFLDSLIKKMNLQSNSYYKKDSCEYRVLQLAIEVYKEPSDFSSKIYFDGKCIKDFSVSDDVVCDFYQNGETKKVKLSLAKLLPQFQNQSDSINKIKAQFETKKDLDKFVKTESKSIDDVHKELNQHLSIPESRFSSWTVNGNAQQFLFATYYRRQKRGWYNLYVPKIDLNKQTAEFVYELLDFLVDNSISIEESPFTYHLKEYFIGKYFASDYVFDGEQLLPIIEKWADDEKKIKYLKDNGVQTSDCNAIQFRKLFWEDKPINFIDKLSDGDIKSGIEFIATASGFERPFVGENQKNILLSLKDKCNDLTDNWDDKKIEDNSKEWVTKEYDKWIIDHYPHIFIYSGALPRQLSYEGKILLNYDDSKCNYFYDKQAKRLYLSDTQGIEDILFEVANDGKSGLDIDSYKALCWEGKVSISKEEIADKNDKIKHLEKENREKDEIIEQYRAKYGDLLDENISGNEELRETNLGTNETLRIKAKDGINHIPYNVIERDGLSREEQVAAHREAEVVIREMLKKNGYDCSNWSLDEEVDDSFKQCHSINQVGNIISPEGESINLVIKSAKGGYIYLSATDFEFLTLNSNSVLIVWDGENVHSVTAEEIFNKDSNVNLIFDTEYTPKPYYAALSKVFQYIKRTTFAVKNPSYNAYDTIKSFGMDSKTDGVQELIDDNDL